MGMVSLNYPQFPQQNIALQEQLGLKILVHGEPERNDMVQYFAEQLDGFWEGAMIRTCG